MGQMLSSLCHCLLDAFKNSRTYSFRQASVVYDKVLERKNQKIEHRKTYFPVKPAVQLPSVGPFCKSSEMFSILESQTEIADFCLQLCYASNFLVQCYTFFFL